jgi:hypothetical protein
MFSAPHSLDAKKCQHICKTLKHLNVKKVILTIFKVISNTIYFITLINKSTVIAFIYSERRTFIKEVFSVFLTHSVDAKLS